VEKTFRTSAAFGRGLTELGFDVTLRLKAVERGIDGADGYLTLRARYDLPPDRYSVGLVVQTQNCEKHNVLEFA